MRWEVLCILAQELAERTPGFFERKGPGVGDHATAAFVTSLRSLAQNTFGADYSEKAVCSAAGFRFDYFFPDEVVAVEFAFGLHDSQGRIRRRFVPLL